MLAKEADGQYNGKWLISLAHETKPLILVVTAIRSRYSNVVSRLLSFDPGIKVQDVRPKLDFSLLEIIFAIVYFP